MGTNEWCASNLKSHRLLLYPVAVHVDGLKDAFGQILFHGRGELLHEEVQEDRELLPLGVRVRQ